MNTKPELKSAAGTFSAIFLCLLFFSLTASNLCAVQPAVAAGARHSLFLKSDGTAWACGENQYGQIGNGSNSNQWTPIHVISGVTAIAGGEKHSLFLKADGTVWACGENSSGQLGDGPRIPQNSPVQVLISDVKAISAGKDFSLFLKTDGSVWACGSNDVGQLGTGTFGDKPAPVQVQISNVSGISAGDKHSLFLKSGGTAWACGSNYFGPFGNGTQVDQPTPIEVMSGVTAISASGNMSLLAKTDGTVWGAGLGDSGQLGVAPSGGYTTTFIQTLISDVKSVCSYGLHSRFLKNDGTVWACGNGVAGHFGNGITGTVLTPTQVQSEIMQVATGSGHCLYLRKDGTVIAAGRNDYGQLGDGTNSQHIFAVPGLSLARIVNVTTTTGGTVSGAGAYDPDTTATLTATPALGYLFGSWEGDATGAANPLLIVMDASKNVVANFYRNTSDTDNDGLDFYDEVVTYGTNPDIADTDEDGFKDGFEVSTGFNPAVATSTPDAQSSIRTAVEFRFNAAEGVSYRIEASTDLESWEIIEASIIGQSGVVTRFYSIENLPKRYFRVRRN